MTAISDLSEEQLKDPAMIEALDNALDEGKDQFINLCTTLEDQTGLEDTALKPILSRPSVTCGKSMDT